MTRVRCDYCARTQPLTVDGRCRGCGAPLPEPMPESEWIEITTFGDRKRQFIRADGTPMKRVALW